MCSRQQDYALIAGLKSSRARLAAPILTLNVDENPGMIGPFMEQNRYTFPVLPAQSYVERMLPGLGIPRIWLVSPSGMLRMELTGFGAQDYQSWKEEVAKMVERVRSADSQKR